MGEIDTIFTKDGRCFDKREIALTDDTKEEVKTKAYINIDKCVIMDMGYYIFQINLTLWNGTATNFIGKKNSKILIEKGKINEYMDKKYISLINVSTVTYDGISTDKK